MKLKDGIRMTGEELLKIKEENKKSLVDAKVAKDSLEKERIVIRYLRELDFIKYEENYQKFLNGLQLGMDGTVFDTYNKDKDNAFKSTHFNLSTILEYAFYLKNIARDECEVDSQLKITFQDLSQYIEHANQVLTDMNYFPGDRLVSNEYGLEIYENPMNYSIVNFNVIMPYLTEEILKMSYNVSFLKLGEQSFWMNSKELTSKMNLERFTPREYEAFFGNGAMKALGIVSKDKKVKTYEKTSK